MFEIENVPVSTIDDEGAESGSASFQADGSYVDLDTQKLVVPDGASIQVTDIPPTGFTTVGGRRLSRRLNTPTGDKQTLVIRVVDGNGQGPSSLEDLKNNWFTDSLNLLTQYAACSYNNMTISAYVGTTDSGVNIQGGAVEVAIPAIAANSNEDQLEDAALIAGNAMLGDLESQFDLVIFCMPPGSGDW